MDAHSRTTINRWSAFLAMFLWAGTSTAAAARTVREIVPQGAPRGAHVLLVGSGMDGTEISVRFSSAAGTVPAEIVKRTATTVELRVPGSAMSGTVVVNDAAMAVGSLPFTVTADSRYEMVDTLVASTAGREPLKQPSGVDREGSTVLTADRMHHRIAAVAPDGTTTAYAGTGRAGFTDGAVATAEFRDPQAIAWNASRTVLYVADTGNHAIRRIANGQVTTIAGTGSRGDRDGVGASAELTLPSGIAVGPDGTVYIADTGNHKIKAISPAGDVLTIAGTGRAGFLDGSVSELRSPEGIAVDRDGILWVADSGNNVIRRIMGGVMSTVTGSTRGGYADGLLTVAQFSNPLDIDIDPFGALIVTDSGNGVIRYIDVLRNSVTTLVGVPGRGMADGSAATASFRNPGAIVRASDGHLDIGDTGNDAIRRAFFGTSLTAVYPRVGPLAGIALRIFGTGFVDGATTVTIGSQPVQPTVADGSMLTVVVPAVATAQVVDVTVTTPAGTATLPGAFTYADAPSIGSVSPTAGMTSGGDRVTIAGTNFLSGQTAVLFGGAPAAIVATTSSSMTVETPPHASGVVDVSVETPSGAATRTSAFTYVPAPLLDAFSPAVGDAGTLVTLTGRNFDPNASGDAVLFGNVTAVIVSAGATQLVVRVPLGAVTAPIRVTTAGGTAQSVTNFVVPVYTEIVVEPASVTLNIGDIRQMAANVRSSDGSVRDLTTTVTWSTGDPTIASVNPTGQIQALRRGLTSVSARLAALTGNATLQVNAVEIPPPDPATTAPPSDPTAPTVFTDSIKFLYEGSNSTQRGVTPGAIVPRRVSVIRGRVADGAGAPLSGVRVAVHRQSEVGYTVSRTDGAFDLVVNGGGTPTLVFTKDGYIPVHRSPAAGWNDMVVAEEVRMIPYDSAVTLIPLSELTTNAVAQGSVTTDESGTRRATLLFQPGTAATMRFSNGAEQALTELHVRATEQTVGRIGAMPADLPRESAYTYCVELSADEAVTAGAASVDFTKPVFIYVENFLGFPVGGRVPTGYYDRQKAQWIASDDGRIIKVLSIVGGVAVIDTDGDGAADDGGSIGVTESERRTLATIYAPGIALWRVPVTHFTPWDHNWGWGLPDGAKDPSIAPPYGDVPLANESCQGGSVIECESLSLGQSIPLAGTPFTLEYRSRNMPGYRPKTEITVTLSEGSVPPPLKRIDLSITIAGNEERYSFSNAPNQKHVFVWNTEDVYGRTVYGDRVAKVTIAYVYDSIFREPDGTDPQRSFAAGGGISLGVGTRREIPLPVDFFVPLRGPRPNQGLGGWTLNTVHAYDPTARMFRLGTGTDIALDSGGLQLTPRSGTTFDYVVPNVDGSLYTYTAGRPATLRRITPEGFVETLAGGGTTTAADGVPAIGTWIGVEYPTTLRTGEIAFLEGFQETFYKIDADGILRVLYTGQDIQQVAASGSGLYFIEKYTLKHVDVGGNVTIIRGPTPTEQVTGVFTSASGSLYLMIHEFTADNPYGGWDRLYRGATLLYSFQVGHHYSSFAVAPNGNVVMAGGIGIWQIVDGEIKPYPLATKAGVPTSLGFLPNGELVWSDAANDVCPFASGRHSCIIAGGLPLARTAVDGGFDAAVPNGTMGLKFSPSGKHVETRDTRIGTLITKVTYDARFGTPARVEDANGLATVIERSTDGKPTAIVAPNGERTELVIGANGFLEAINGPGGVNHAFTYTAQGMMRTHRDPRGKTSDYDYDADGRLRSAADAGSGSKTLTFSEFDDTDTVTVTTAEGRRWNYVTKRQDAGSVDRTVTNPLGLVSRLISTPDSVLAVAPDGTRADVSVVPDTFWKSLVPVPIKTILRLPSGKSVTVTTERLTTGTPTNPYGLSVQETVTTNGVSMTRIYDAPNRSIRTVSPLNRSISVFFDDKGRLRDISPPGVASLLPQYDARGRIETLTQGDRVSRYVWNSYDQLESLTTATGVTSFEYDSAGRVKTQTLPGGRVVSYTYDAGGNILSLTPAGRPAYTFTYDNVGLNNDYVAPAGTTTGYVFNRDRQLTAIQQPGASISLAYDRGRLQTMSGSGRTLTYAYHGGGQLQSIADSSGPLLAFDFDGPLPTAMSWSGDVAGSVSWSYDDNLRVSAESVNDVPIAYSYDNDSLMTGAGSEVIRRDAVSGRVSGTTVGKTVDSYVYNGFGEIDRYSVTQNGATIFNVVYARDKGGRIITKTETRFGFRVVNQYEYNAARRLETVKRDGTVVSVYGYDANGNRTSYVGAETVTSTSYDAEDRLVAYGPATYTYTPWGALSTRTDTGGTTSFEYDAFGNLRVVRRPGAPVVEYVIDGANRRVAKKVDGALTQRWLYSNGVNIVAEIGPTGAVTRFVYGARASVPDHMIRNGVIYRFIVDHLGSVRYVLDATTGSIMQSVDYDEFGRVVFDSNPGYQPFGFAGGLFDPDTGLVRFGARDYDASTGRWTAKDPIGFGGGSGNLYSYTFSDPVNFVDPSGLFGFGLVGTEQTDGGNLASGVGQTASVGAGLFYSDWDRKAVEPGAFVTAGGFARAPFGSAAYPSDPCTHPWAVGGFAGAGAGVFVTNAKHVRDLEGAFHTVSLNAGWKARVLAAQFAWGTNASGENIWVFGYGGPGTGPGGGFGASLSYYDTNTWTTGK